MPKGYNADGTKKARPAGSGRRPKGNIPIAPQISPEAAAVLKGLKKQKINQNEFISQAILEKAANDATKKVAIKNQTERATPGQVDLVDMLQDIHQENVTIAIRAGASLAMPTSYQERLDEIREQIAQQDEQEQAELNEWLDMPALETWNKCQRLLHQYGKKKHRSALFIAITAQMPEPEFKRTWRCWIEVIEENGKLVDYCRGHASLQYVVEIMENTDWKQEKTSHDTTLFLLPINNPIKEKKPAKPKPPKRVKPASSNLIDIFALDEANDLPEWLKPIHTPAAELPEDAILVEEAGTLEESTIQAWQEAILATEDTNPTPATFEITSGMSKPNHQEERKIKAYTELLQAAFSGLVGMSTELVLKAIVKKRKRGPADAENVLAECFKLNLCQEFTGIVTLNHP